MRLSAPLVSTCMVPIMALMPRQWNCAFASSPCPPCHASLKGVVTYGHTGILSVQPRVWYPIFSSDMLHIWMNLGKTRCPQGSCLRGAGSLQLMTTKIKKRHPHSKNKWVFSMSWVGKCPAKWSTTKDGESLENSFPYPELHLFFTISHSAPHSQSWRLQLERFVLASPSRVTEFSFN